MRSQHVLNVKKLERCCELAILGLESTSCQVFWIGYKETPVEDEFELLASALHTVINTSPENSGVIVYLQQANDGGREALSINILKKLVFMLFQSSEIVKKKVRGCVFVVSDPDAATKAAIRLFKSLYSGKLPILFATSSEVEKIEGFLRSVDGQSTK